ncbi:MAG: DUF3169 family protein [Intestinibacter bartlettii]
MSSNRVEEIKKEDKKAFKGFAIMMVISAMIGAVIGGGFKYLQENLGDNLSEFLVNRLMMITPYASLVLSILVIIVSVVIYKNSRKNLKLWNQSDEQEEMIDNIEEKLSYVLLFTSVNLILGFFLLWSRNGIIIRRLIYKSNFIFSWIHSMCSINYINPK